MILYGIALPIGFGLGATEHTWPRCLSSRFYNQIPTRIKNWRVPDLLHGASSQGVQVSRAVHSLEPAYRSQRL